MNGQFFGNTTVTNLPPIVTRQVRVIHRYEIVNQPHICEDITQICTHCIKRHQFCQKPICCNNTDYSEENLGFCPGMMAQEETPEVNNTNQFNAMNNNMNF